MLPIVIDRVSEHHFISSWLKAGNEHGRLLVVDLGMNAGEFSGSYAALSQHPRGCGRGQPDRPRFAILGKPALLQLRDCVRKRPCDIGVDRVNSTASSSI